MKKATIFLLTLSCIFLSSCSNGEEDNYSNEKAQLIVSTEGTVYQNIKTDNEGEFALHMIISASDITGVETSALNVDNITVNNAEWRFYSPDFTYGDPIYTSLALDGNTYCNIVWAVDEHRKTIPLDAKHTLCEFVEEMTRIILQKGSVSLAIYGEAPNPRQRNTTFNIEFNNELEFKVKN
ncbi:MULTISPECIES: hypothetical protein [unclassified Dysgonomonas]|uniref:hypothetical protein n=1 Tax=unclassified Dysgonomonas TaxID=2630389 RepID=UPI002476E2E5|nr:MULTISPECIES: hypothetical protein [unclassified Dysgonomonas]